MAQLPAAVQRLELNLESKDLIKITLKELKVALEKTGLVVYTVPRRGTAWSVWRVSASSIFFGVGLACRCCFGVRRDPPCMGFVSRSVSAPRK